ncbi:MAG: hypothetical protein LC667_07015 [Thioalkalivibrio sp.]|nr:hypothetical protein [Thioalkalivibrio sp.]
MQFQKTPRAAMAAAHAGPRDDAAAPQLANLRAARELDDGPGVLEFRGRAYRARPVSFADGMRLLERAAAVEHLAADPSRPGAIREYTREIRRTVNDCWRLLQPAWLRWTGLWRLRRNPFRAATLQEVQDLLGFTGRCQTTSRVRHRATTDPRPR